MKTKFILLGLIIGITPLIYYLTSRSVEFTHEVKEVVIDSIPNKFTDKDSIYVNPDYIRYSLRDLDSATIEKFIYIAYKESRFNRLAFRDKSKNKNGGNDHGLFQINDKWHKNLFNNRDMYDVDVAIASALEIYNNYGLKPWRMTLK